MWSERYGEYALMYDTNALNLAQIIGRCNTREIPITRKRWLCKFIDLISFETPREPTSLVRTTVASEGLDEIYTLKSNFCFIVVRVERSVDCFQRKGLSHSNALVYKRARFDVLKTFRRIFLRRKLKTLILFNRSNS